MDVAHRSIGFEPEPQPAPKRIHDVQELDAIRRMLFRMEDGYRKKDDLRV